MAEQKKNTTPVLASYLAAGFDGWYVGGHVHDRKFVVDRNSVSQFDSAKQKIFDLNTRVPNEWFETWQINEIILGN